MPTPSNLTPAETLTLTDSLSQQLQIPSCPTNTRQTQQLRVQNWMNNPTYYTTDDINNSIQDGLDEICAFTGCIYKSAVLPFAPGKSYYDMLTLYPDYIGMVGIFNSVIKRWMIPQTIRKYDQSRIDWEAAAGVPYYWAPVSHRYIAIFKKPITPSYGNMWIYYRASAPTIGDTDAIPIPDDHIQVLDSYNIRDLWEQQQEFTKASDYFETYRNELEMLRKLVRARTNSDRIPSLRGSGGEG